MKIFKHTGRGFYLMSCVIVKANSIEEATSLIRTELDKAGLIGLDIDVEEVTDDVIHVDDGDY